METFETQVTVSINHKDFPGAWDVQPITIKWQLELEMRSYGVKSIDLFVPDQEVLLQYSTEDENGDPIDKEVEFTLKNVEVYPGYDHRDYIYPNELYITDDKIEVDFS